jgi:hypothetical protein
MTTSQQPPELPGFSTPIQTMGTSAAGVRDALLWGGGAVLLGLVFLVVMYFVGQMPGREVGGVIGLVGFVVALLFSVIFWVALWRIMGRRVWLFPEGVVESNRGKHKACRWDEVEELVYWSRIADVGIQKTDGTRLTFGFLTVDRAHELARAVVEGVVSSLAPALSERIRSGESVSFGRVEADKSGLTIYYKAHRSPKPRSFYKGPWPRAQRPTLLAKVQDKDLARVAWRDVIDLQETDECDLILDTTSGPVPLCCWPDDVPNSVVLPAIAKLIHRQ